MPPGLDTAGNALKHPQPCFERRFAREPERYFPREAWCLVQSHRFRQDLVPANHPVDKFPRIAVLLEARRLGPGLMVEQEHIRTFADPAEISKGIRLGRNRPAI